MLDVAPQMLSEIMQRAPRRADGRRPVFQAEAIQRGHLEMFPQGKPAVSGAKVQPS
jgi:hypothetical protein